MYTVALSALFVAGVTLAQTTTTSLEPLVDHTYSYPDLPYQAEPTGDIRGAQVGYNECNTTTQNQESYCQTLIVDQIDDFCLFAPPTPNTTIADSEGYEVAWCTTNTHGTRVIPPGALQGVQHLTTPDYIMIVGYIDQTLVDMAESDYGGELDPRGADELGNPIGGLVYSNLYPTGNEDNSSYTQVIDWTEFIGNGQFCIKICNPSETNASDIGLCNNVYDEIGISYNCPNAAQNGTFEVCDADSMTPVGVYTSDGETLTWTQPWSGTWTIPYTASVPASSNCRTYASTDLYTDLVSATASASSGASSSTATSGSGSGSTAATRTGTSSGASATSTASSSSSSGAGSVRISALATLAGVAFAMVFLA